jgi:hypothetical protein
MLALGASTQDLLSSQHSGVKSAQTQLIDLISRTFQAHRQCFSRLNGSDDFLIVLGVDETRQLTPGSEAAPTHVVLVSATLEFGDHAAMQRAVGRLVMMYNQPRFIRIGVSVAALGIGKWSGE